MHTPRDAAPRRSLDSVPSLQVSSLPSWHSVTSLHIVAIVFMFGWSGYILLWHSLVAYGSTNLLSTYLSLQSVRSSSSASWHWGWPSHTRSSWIQTRLPFLTHWNENSCSLVQAWHPLSGVLHEDWQLCGSWYSAEEWLDNQDSGFLQIGSSHNDGQKCCW